MTLLPLAPLVVEAFFARRCLPVFCCAATVPAGYRLEYGVPGRREELAHLLPTAAGWVLLYPGGVRGEASSLNVALHSLLLLLEQRR